MCVYCYHSTHFDYLKCIFCQGEKQIGHGRSLPTPIVYVDRLSTSRSVYFVRVKKIGHDSLGPETEILIHVVRLMLLKRLLVHIIKIYRFKMAAGFRLAK